MHEEILDFLSYIGIVHEFSSTSSDNVYRLFIFFAFPLVALILQALLFWRNRYV